MGADDAERLMQLSRQTFFDAFAHLNNAEDMNAFAAGAFTIATFKEQLATPHSKFFYAYADGEVAGYLKLNYAEAQTEFQDPNTLEVERIYVLKEFQGRQIGGQLIDFAIEQAIQHNFDYIWLGVWEHNSNAIRFYQRLGFEAFSSHAFMLGSDEQTDILMRRKLDVQISD